MDSQDIALRDQQETYLVRQFPKILFRLKRRLTKVGFTPEESLYLCGVAVKENPCIKGIVQSNQG